MSKPLPILSYGSDLFRQLHTPARRSAYQIRGLAQKLSAAAFSNLGDFPYLYFTAGATEAIDTLLVRQETQVLVDEYRYVFLHKGTSVHPRDTVYRSFPFAGDGKFGPIPTDQDVILDCAYMFASNMNHNKTLPDNVQQVIFSLSKSHNVADYRIGWFFSKIKIPHMDVLQYEYGYVNSLAGELIDNALGYIPNELYHRNKLRMSSMFSKAGLVEGDTNLFALDENKKRIPYYTI